VYCIDVTPAALNINHLSPFHTKLYDDTVKTYHLQICNLQHLRKISPFSFFNPVPEIGMLGLTNKFKQTQLVFAKFKKIVFMGSPKMIIVMVGRKAMCYKVICHCLIRKVKFSSQAKLAGGLVPLPGGCLGACSWNERAFAVMLVMLIRSPLNS